MRPRFNYGIQLGFVLTFSLCGSGQLATAADRSQGRADNMADDLSCEKHRDCLALPSLCPTCAPCKPLPWPVGNRRAVERIMKKRKRVRCARRACPACPGGRRRLPGRPACVGGRCVLTVAPTVDVSGAFRGDVRSKSLHVSICRQYACKHCTAVFLSVQQAAKAGFTPHDRCGAALPPPHRPPERVPRERCYEDCLRQNKARAESWESIQASCRASCARKGRVPGAGDEKSTKRRRAR